MPVPSPVCNHRPQREVRHDPLVPASAILTPAPALSMPSVLSPYLSWLTATPYYVSWQYHLPQPRSARRSRYLPTGISLAVSTPVPATIHFSPSPSCDPSQQQSQLRSIPAPAPRDPFQPQAQLSQHQSDISTPTPTPAVQCPNASHLNTCPNANSSCPPTILAQTPALPPTISMSAVHTSTRPYS